MEFLREWAMPSRQTFSIKPIERLLVNEIEAGKVVEPFAYVGTLKSIFRGNSEVEITNNDLNEEYKTDYHMDALAFLKQFTDNSVDYVVYDPPYSPRQVAECYKGIGKQVTQDDTKATFWSTAKDEISRILKVGGKAICFGWNSNGVGNTRGFDLEKVLLVSHGGNNNDTICTVEVKKAEQLEFC